MDLIVRKAKLRGSETLQDIGVEGEKIVEIAPEIKASAPKELDAEGRLTTSGFVNPHHHPDKSMVRDQMEPNKTYLFDEAIELTWHFKRDFEVDDIVKRIEKVVQMAVSFGTTHLRTFADVDTIGGLKPVKAELKAKELFRDIIDIQVVAFPQEGIIRNEGTADLLREAMKLGADVVGGLPWYEHSDEDAKTHIDICFDIAKEFNKDIHMLVDNTNNPNSRTLEFLAVKKIKSKFPRTVTASHAEALAFYDDIHADKVIQLVKQAGIHICSNAHVSLAFEGHQARQPIPRGLTRVRELLRAGVNVITGQDDCNDPYYPFGRMDQLEVALFMAHAAHFIFPPDLDILFNMITVNGAQALVLQNYGIKVGNLADLVVIDAPDPKEALRLMADRRFVIYRGRLVAETKREGSVYRV